MYCTATCILNPRCHHNSLFYFSGSMVPGIDPGPAVFGVVKRITDQHIDSHTNQQVNLYSITEQHIINRTIVYCRCILVDHLLPK